MGRGGKVKVHGQGCGVLHDWGNEKRSEQGLVEREELETRRMDEIVG